MRNLSVTVRSAALFLVAAGALLAASLKPKTDSFYLDHLKRMEASFEKRKKFLLVENTAGLREKVRGGFIYIKEDREEKEPPDGLIHHWEGAVFIPGVTVGEVVAFVQNYDQHKKVYAPEVTDSKTLRHDGNQFHIRLRLLKKKVLTVVLETEHDVQYKPVSPTRWESASHTTKVTEVEKAGTASEKEQPPGTGHGFVWRLDSYWRFEEADGGVYVECSSLTLSRDVPFGMTRIIRPIISDLPEESLRGVLTKTRDGLKR